MYLQGTSRVPKLVRRPTAADEGGTKLEIGGEPPFLLLAVRRDVGRQVHPVVACLLRLVAGRRLRGPWPGRAGADSVVRHVLYYLLRHFSQDLCWVFFWGGRGGEGGRGARTRISTLIFEEDILFNSRNIGYAHPCTENSEGKTDFRLSGFLLGETPKRFVM